jgi:isopentenyl diphosphate isomerase/L-lactate dehydrogenase-like FMN-dependent dehydrogenase
MAKASFSGVANEIYFRGLGGERPPLPMTYAALEAAARDVMTAEAFAYVAGGAGDEHTMRANVDAFAAHAIVPRMLREVVERDLETDVLGTSMATPVLTAPIGVLSIVHDDPEVAVARAAAKLGVTSVLSTAASTALETVAEAAPGAAQYYQLYWPKDMELAESLVRRATAAGFRAIVVTLDTWSLGWRPRDLALGHLPFLKGLGIANYLSDPVFRSRLKAAPESSAEAMTAAVFTWAGTFGNAALSWSDVARLREWTTLPIIVKGVCHPDDARAALYAGSAGIIVSNHGGRQVDRARAAIDCLPDVARAVGERATVFFDSGIRCGGDILVALTLGAHAVLVGRPFVYGLALAGQSGVEHVLRNLLADFDASLALAGYRTAREAHGSALG